MLSSLTQKFKNEIITMLPGDLAMFNFADMKRRNDRLGHHKVDEEIEEFAQLLARSVKNTGYGMRIAGDKWLGLFAPNSLDAMQKLLNDFKREQKILIGWESLGCKDGIQKSQQVTVEAKIIRAMYCVYSYIETVENLELKVEELLDNCYGLPVNIPYQLADVIGSERNRWQCVSNYPSKLPVCPFCESNSFNWLDGDSTIYYAYGFCNVCGAEVTFQNAR